MKISLFLEFYNAFRQLKEFLKALAWMESFAVSFKETF
jgi:hypothetical protein